MRAVQTFKIPYSGRLLVSHMAAYGLAVALRSGGFDAFISHDPNSLEMTPLVAADVDSTVASGCVRKSADACEAAVESDVVPGKTGNSRTPALRARATSPVGAHDTLLAREQLLRSLERDGAGAELPLKLAAGLGAPAIWLHDHNAAAKPHPDRGATGLDGVPYNIGSDIVRGALRRSLPSAQNVTGDEVKALFVNSSQRVEEAEDRLRWSPGGTYIASWCQWLAALGMCLLPVGLMSDEAARTPGYRRDVTPRQITLPILSRPISLPRLRALLELQVLVDAGFPESSAGIRAAGKLRALGVPEVMTFPVRNSSNSTMVTFSFDLGTEILL